MSKVNTELKNIIEAALLVAGQQLAIDKLVSLFPEDSLPTRDEVKAALNAVSAKLTTEAIAAMLKQTDIDKKDPKAVAQEFLATNGLG